MNGCMKHKITWSLQIYLSLSLLFTSLYFFVHKIKDYLSPSFIDRSFKSHNGFCLRDNHLLVKMWINVLYDFNIWSAYYLTKFTLQEENFPWGMSSRMITLQPYNKVCIFRCWLLRRGCLLDRSAFIRKYGMLVVLKVK